MKSASVYECFPFMLPYNAQPVEVIPSWPVAEDDYLLASSLRSAAQFIDSAGLLVCGSRKSTEMGHPRPESVTSIEQGENMNRRRPTVTNTRTKRHKTPEQPATEVIEEKTRMVRAPVVEVRKAATLAQALTEPQTVVVKPKTKAVMRSITRRAG